MVASLWGEDFTIESSPEKVKKIVEKVNKPKAPKATKTSTRSSKANDPISMQSKLAGIRENVLKILGVYKDQTICIYTREALHNYITEAISNGVIAIDTETNNSLEPITCKLMGPCIYTPGQKNAYIPINHVNPDTRERLKNQLTEEDVKEELDDGRVSVASIFKNPPKEFSPFEVEEEEEIVVEEPVIKEKP